jgi:ankyrin repeat protein
MKTIITIFCLAGGALFAAEAKLADAAMQGDKAAVRSLIAARADVNAAQGDGMTALHWAAYHDDLDLTRALLQAGANAKVTTRLGGVTPLFFACTNGNAAMIAALLDAGADANSSKEGGTTALMTAAASGSAPAVKLLLDRGAQINAKENVHGQTAAMFAAALNRSDVIRLLASRGADLNIATSSKKLERVQFDQDGNIVENRPGGRGGRGGRGGQGDQAAAPTANEGEMTPEEIAEAKAKAQATAKAELDLLAKSMSFSTVDYLIDSARSRPKAGDVAARPPRKVGPDFAGGMTALLYAAREGHLDAVRALVEAKANINQVSEGEKTSPMLLAIINGRLDVAKYLLDQGADPNLVAVSGATALYATIDVQWAPKVWFPQPSVEQEKTSYLDLMKELLDHGANPNTKINEKLWYRSFTNDYTWVDPAGATAFWRAAQSSDTAAMQLLIQHGADPKIATTAGDTPLHAAAGIGWAANWSVNAPVPLVDAVKYCVELGLDVNTADLRGYTALHGAAYLGNNDMVNFLVGKGAKTDVKSRAGDSTADMANGPTRFGQPHPETVALLEKLGSPNSHNCRSDQCVVAARANIYDRRTPADFVQSAEMDAFAKSIGFESAEYRADVPAPAGRPGGN